MVFADYAALRTTVQTLLEGDDISQSDLSVAVLDTLIGLGEVRIYRELHSSTQDTPFSQTTTNNQCALPSDFLEMHGAPYVGTFKVAVYKPWEYLQNCIQLEAAFSDWYGQANHPVWYSYQNDSMFFYPVMPDGTTVVGQYYKRFGDLAVSGLNALFNRHPDVFIYAALAESAPVLGETARLPVWQQAYTSKLEEANEQERRRYTRGGKLATAVA